MSRGPQMLFSLQMLCSCKRKVKIDKPRMREREGEEGYWNTKKEYF